MYLQDQKGYSCRITLITEKINKGKVNNSISN